MDQAPLSVGFSKQEYWSVLPCCSQEEDLPNTGFEPTSLMSSAMAGEFFTTSATWEALGIQHHTTWTQMPMHLNRIFLLGHRLFVGCGEDTMDKGGHSSNSPYLPGQGTLHSQALSLRTDLVEIFLFSARKLVILIEKLWLLDRFIFLYSNFIKCQDECISL